jgi:hypothetical protein
MRKPRVFLSYRRDDATHQVGRIFDHLEHVFGRDNVFKDVDSIPAGADFRQILVDGVTGCDVFVTVIGDHWLTVSDKQGKRRLDNPDDFVRIEVEAALGQRIPVIPVLVGAAGMPAEGSLPEQMRPLVFRNAVKVRPDPDFRSDIQKLVTGVRAAAHLSPRAFERLQYAQRRARRLAVVFALIAAISITAAVFFAMRDSSIPARQEVEFEHVPLTMPNLQEGETLVRARGWGPDIRIDKDDEIRLYKTSSEELPFLLVVRQGESPLASVFPFTVRPDLKEWVTKARPETSPFDQPPPKTAVPGPPQ